MTRPSSRSSIHRADILPSCGASGGPVYVSVRHPEVCTPQREGGSGPQHDGGGDEAGELELPAEIYAHVRELIHVGSDSLSGIRTQLPHEQCRGAYEPTPNQGSEEDLASYLLECQCKRMQASSGPTFNASASTFNAKSVSAAVAFVPSHCHSHATVTVALWTGPPTDCILRGPSDRLHLALGAFARPQCSTEAKPRLRWRWARAASYSATRASCYPLSSRAVSLFWLSPLPDATKGTAIGRVPMDGLGVDD
ncbi:hypothetical protein BKA93DRAFT_828012 [Sparassis latifolia]